MEWIKKHYDQFALLVGAGVLIISCIWLLVSQLSFNDAFASAQRGFTQGTKVDALATEALAAAKAGIAAPAQWSAHEGLLFVSRHYVDRYDPAQGTNVLIDPLDPKSPPLHPPIPNQWFYDHHLEAYLLDPNALAADPDKDGFTLLDEFLAGTDPNDPESHAPYWTKLRLRQFVKVPFRMVFRAYDSGEFQIETVDVKQPSLFVHMDEMIEGTKFKVVKFEEKHKFNPATESDVDVSELTVENQENMERSVLVLDATTNIPELYAQFAYLWNKTELRVKKGALFSLPPQNDVKYKLIDISENEALIQLMGASGAPEGEPIKIPRLETANP